MMAVGEKEQCTVETVLYEVYEMYHTAMVKVGQAESTLRLSLKHCCASVQSSTNDFIPNKPP